MPLTGKDFFFAQLFGKEFDIRLCKINDGEHFIHAGIMADGLFLNK